MKKPKRDSKSGDAVGMLRLVMPIWINVNDQLPVMFQNVIVWGVRKKENVVHQSWQARRFTGCSSGFDVERDKLWQWLTPTDGQIEQVTHWMPMPDTVPVIA